MSDTETFQDLIGRVRAGEDTAAAELVRRFEPMVRRAARVRLADPRLGRVLDSMDICQSVMASFFVRAAMGQYELDTPDQLMRLLATMAKNKLANQANGQRAARRDVRRVDQGAF
ncbi:RNA polymerase sigma factor, partial [Singulisphaera rosea]